LKVVAIWAREGAASDNQLTAAKTATAGLALVMVASAHFRPVGEGKVWLANELVRLEFRYAATNTVERRNILARREL